MLYKDEWNRRFQRADGNNEERVLTGTQLGKMACKPLEGVFIERETEAESMGIPARSPWNTRGDITKHLLLQQLGFPSNEPLSDSNGFACLPRALCFIPWAILSA